jgi:hypothetical protein
MSKTRYADAVVEVRTNAGVVGKIPAEFPILGKYRFLHTPIAKPYVEAGPIFRYVAARASYLSNAGFAIGGGVELKLLVLKLSPEIRFSRWGSDAATSIINAPPSNLNQAEFLTAYRSRSSDQRCPRINRRLFLRPGLGPCRQFSAGVLRTKVVTQYFARYRYT